MKNYENCPVNEWNGDTAGLLPETVWPWDILVTRSPGDAGPAQGNSNDHPLSPSLRPDPTAVTGATRLKQIPSNQLEKDDRGDM